MKQIAYLLAFAFLAVSFRGSAAVADTSLLGQWNRANDYYTAGEYARAVEGYRALEKAGYESAKLYYNLGNAYYKMDSQGRAILNYNKALKLAPGDEDIRHNLEVANARTVNRIDAIPDFILVRWFKNLRQTFDSNTWAVFSLVLFGLALSMTVLYLLSASVVRRKVGFTLGVVALALFVYTLANSVAQKRSKTGSGEAIVLSSAAAVKSSPDTGGKDVFILNEGAKVEVLSSIGPWSEIVIASGNKGWIETGAIARISE